MLELEKLNFSVDSSQLKDALDAVNSLSKAMGDLGKAQANETKIAIQEAKVKEAQAKAAIAMAKATEAEEKAKAASVKASETKSKADERAASAATKLAKESTKAAEAAKQQADQAEKQNSILQRNKDILEFMTQGFSKGQASQLAYAKATSATVDELKQLEGVLQSQRKLIGGDAFDSSIGGLIKLKNQYTEIKEAVRQYNNDIELSRNQTRELARDKERIIERMKMEGKSFSDIKNAIRDYNQEYVTTANAVNSLIKQEKEIERSHRESMNAVRNLAKEEERMAAVVQNLNLQTDSGSSISERAAVAMATYERNLRLAGIAGVDAAKKLDVYRKQQLLVVEAEEKRQKQYLTRAIIPQFSDIFVGLTTGQSPLTIMLQQLPQIQDLFTLTGVEAKDTSKVIGEAAVEMISRLKDTAIAVGDAVGSAFTIVATNMVNAAASSLTFGEGIENTRIELERTYGVNSKVVQVFNLLSGSLTRATTLGLGFGAAIAGPVLIALFQTQKALTDLNKNLISSGANIGKTRDELLSMAKSMDITGASSNKILGVFSEIASTGKISADVMQEVARAAIALEKAGGKNTEDSIKQIAKVYEDPLEALSEYRIATGLVTQDEIARVDALVKMGNQIEAVDYAQRIVAQGLVEESKRMLDGLSPVEELWKDIKTAISDVWTEIVNLSNSEPIVSSLKTVFQTVAVIVTEVYYGIVGMAQSIAGLAAAGSAAISDITSMDTNFTASKAVLSAIGDQDKAREAAYKNTIARIMQEGKYAREETTKTAKAQADAAKANSDAEKGRIARNKALEDVNKWEEKTAKDRMTREQFINKSLEDRLKISKDLTDEDKRRIRTMAGTEWDDAQKKPKKSEGDKEAERLRKSYIKDLEKINEISSEAIGYQENYSKAQMKVLEIMQSPSFAKYSTEQRKRIAADAEAAIAQADLAEAQKLMNKLLAQADGLGADYYENLRRIQALFDKGDSSFGSDAFEKAKKALYAATEQGKQYVAFMDRIRLKEQELNDARKSLEVDRITVYMTDAQAEILRTEQSFADKRLQVQRDYLAKVAEIQRSSVGTDPTKLQQLMQDEANNLSRALGNIDFEQQTNSLKQFSSEFKILIEQVGMLGSSLEGAFGNLGKNVSSSLTSFTKLAAVLERNQKQMKEFKGSEEARAKAVNKNSIEELGYYADAAKAAKNMFGEKTAAAKAFGAIEKVLHVARLGMMLVESAGALKAAGASVAADGIKQASSIQTMVVSGYEAVMNTLAKIPPPLNIAAAAGVAAIVAGLIGAVGGSFSFGGGGGSAPPTYNEGKGTVFGDSSAKSSSLDNSRELLGEANRLTQRYSSQMVLHLRNIDANIGGLVNLMVRTGNLSASAQGISTGTKLNGPAGMISSVTDGILKAIPLMPGVGTLVNKLIGSIFGSTKTSITASGITGGSQSLQEIMQNQFQAQYFTDVKIKKSGLFGSSTKYRTYLTEADAELEQQITAVFQGVYEAVLQGATSLGSAEETVRNVLNSYVVNLGKVNLSGTAEQMQEALSAAFSAASDDIAKTAFPGLEKFQSVGEGYFETLVRVASELETVNSMFDMLGIKLYALGVSGVEASQSLINLFGGISDFQSATSEYYDSFYTEEEKVAKMTEQLTTVFSDLGIQMPAMNGSLQESLNAYRDIVNALDLTDSAQQEVYYTLISISDAFYQVAEAATSTTASVEQLLAGLYAQTRTSQDIANSIYSLQNQAAELKATYADLVSGATGTNSAMYKLTTEGMHPLEKSAYDEVLAQQARIEAEKAAQQAAVAAAKAREDAERERLQSIQNAFNEFEKSINSQKSTIQENINAWKELFSTLESAIDNLYGNVLSTSQASAEEGRKFISDAIRTATTTGVMPAASEVQSAIDAVMQGLDSSIFASKADADVARLKFAAELQALQNLVVPKISDAERQIKVLEDTYENAKNQLSTLVSINSNVLSLTQAIYNLNAVSGKNIQVPAYASGGSYAGGAAIVGDGGGPELINFRTPGTIYNASSTANMADNTAISAEALVALIQEVQMLRAEVRADVTHNSKTAKILDRVLVDGTSLAVTTTP